MSWRVAKSLLVLRKQVDEQFPSRNRDSDGTIGDERHSALQSDHNPDSGGVVRAMDLTHDPAGGFDSYSVADFLREHWDSRVKYIISNSRIAAKSIQSGVWRPYSGSNPHDHHVHISVVSGSEADDERAWTLPWSASPKPLPAQDVVARDVLRSRMAKHIVDLEARRDSAGHLMVYNLPANDGGGRYEVAGINEKYNKDTVDHLVYLLKHEQFEDAEKEAEEFILRDSAVAQQWTSDPRVEFMLRDTVFHRGEAGAAKIMQLELGFSGTAVDGIVGPLTRARIVAAEKDPESRLKKLRDAREAYERNYVGYRANFWRGFVNRWNNALKFAEGLKEGPVA